MRAASLLLGLTLATTAQNVITTTAGGGNFAFRGDGGPAKDASLGGVFGVAVDSAGNIYASDVDNSRIVRISPRGTLTVIAGDGFRGYFGDDILATATSLNSPSDIVVDSSGSVYFADQSNNRVRRIDPDGRIFTIAGGGTSANDNIPAVQSLLSSPAGIAFDNFGNLYIAESGRNRVRRVNANGVITTVAGNGNQGFSGDGGPAIAARLNDPSSVAVDTSGNLFIADRANHRIRRVNLAGTITTFAGSEPGFAGDGGPATSARLSAPSGIRFDASGALFVADRGNHAIRRIDFDRTITTVAGTGRSGFTGDDGPATRATFAGPPRIAIDADGTLIIPDFGNNRLRSVSPSGTVTTIAGTGSRQFFGDGGSGRSALLNLPTAIAFESDGSLLIADTRNHRVRRLSPAGIISTVAGNGLAVFAGDGGPATQASLNEPRAVAADAAGNIYIADTENDRIRKVTKEGVISTIASGAAKPEGVAVDSGGVVYYSETQNGAVKRITTSGAVETAATGLQAPAGLAFDNSGVLHIAEVDGSRVVKLRVGGGVTLVAGISRDDLSGDGGPATQGGISQPQAIAFDRNGVLYIAAAGNNRIRRVDTAGIITTYAGSAGGVFAGDGGAATSARLAVPRGVAVDASGNVYIADSGNDRIRVVLAAPPTLQVSRDSVSLTSKLGGAPTAEQNISVVSNVPGVAYNVELKTSSGGDWLFATAPLSGRLPLPLGIIADPDRLPSGNYEGTIAISSPVTVPSSVTIPVKLEVEQGTPPRLSARPSAVAFSGAGTQTIYISNEGSGVADFTVAASVVGGGNWLRAFPTRSIVTPAAPSAISVAVNPAGLQPGTYAGRIAITPPTGDRLNIPVTLTVSAIPQTILLSQTGLSFTAVVRGGTPPPQNFGILNIGRGVMDWTVDVSTFAGGGWLSAGPASGQSDAASLQVPLVDVAINASGLAPGDYYGQIRVRSPLADNSPQVVSVVLNVLPEGSDPGPIVRPTGLIFTSALDGPAPSSQAVLVSNLTSRPITFVTGRIPQDPNNWFTHSPTDAGVAPDQPARVVIQPTGARSTDRFQRGTLTLQFADGTARTISLLQVVGGGTPTVQTAKLRAANCAPARLFPVMSSLAQGFSAPAGWPTTIEVRVADDCGAPQIGGSVVANFSNGDPPVSLNSLRDGRWVGTWLPRSARVAQVTVGVTATDPATNVTGTAQVVGGLRSNANPPVIDRVAASPAPGSVAPLAPGSLITISGSGLATSDTQASGSPLPTELGGVTAVAAGRPLPLVSVGPSQIRAVVPYELGVNTRQQIVVSNGPSLVASEPLTFASAQPVVVTVDGSGAGQARATVNGTLADRANPAKAGDTIEIQATGLGAVEPAVAAGALTPQSPVSSVVGAVSVRIGGAEATTVTATLLPGATGVYRVTAVVPEGAAKGDAVELVITAAGLESPAVTVAVR